MDGFLGRFAIQADVPFQQTHSIVDMVTGSGPVVLAVLYVLLGFSIVSWGIMLYKFRQLRQARRESERFTAVFWETKNLPAIHTAALEMQESPLAQVFRAGYQELMRLTRTRKSPEAPTEPVPLTIPEEGGIDNIERAMRRALREQVTRLERALTF